MSNDRSYFMRRAAQEHSAAANATGDKAREAHQEMARRYQGLASDTKSEAAEQSAS